MIGYIFPKELILIKQNALKECDICHYLYFKDIGFKYEPYLGNGCHDLMQKPIDFNDVAIVSIKKVIIESNCSIRAKMMQ